MIHHYSGIDTALRCRRRFYIEYIEQPADEGVSGVDLTFGTAMHSALQASMEGEDAHQTFKVFWDSYKPLQAEAYRGRELAKMAPEFIRKFEKMHKPHMQPLHLEKTLQATIEDTQWEGTPDFIGKHKGELAIVDYKTSQWAYPREKILSSPQMPLYAVFTEKSLLLSATKLVYIVFVKSTGSIQTLETPLTPAMRDRALETCVSMARDLQLDKDIGRFPRNPASCLMGKIVCPWFSKCHPEGVTKNG